MCWIEVLDFDDVAVSYFTTTQSETFNEPLTGALVLLVLGGLFSLSSMSLESDEEFDEDLVSNDSSDDSSSDSVSLLSLKQIWLYLVQKKLFPPLWSSIIFPTC